LSQRGPDYDRKTDTSGYDQCLYRAAGVGDFESITPSQQAIPDTKNAKGMLVSGLEAAIDSVLRMISWPSNSDARGCGCSTIFLSADLSNMRLTRQWPLLLILT
jgi:hypothetical protein